MGEDQGKQNIQMSESEGKLNSGQTASQHRLSKEASMTAKITVSHQASKRVTFDGGTIKRLFDTLCMLPVNN